MRNRVVVTGLGCVSPVGNNVKDTWEALLAGRSGAAPITTFDASAHKTKFAAEVKGFDPAALFGTRDARKMDRFTQFATAATLEAMEQASLKIDESNRDRVGILIGTGIGGIITLLEQYDVLRERGPERISPFLIPMMISDSAAGNIAIRVGARGPNMSLATACASGTNSLGEAAEMIRRGSADVMIAGASEAAITAVTMAGMNVMTALSTRNDDPQRASRPFDKDRDGFLMQMHRQRIGVGVHYRSISSLSVYQKRFGWTPDMVPIARDIGDRTVSLPLSAKLTEQDVQDVIGSVRSILGGSA